MAKKMLINANMLLATPRRNEANAPIAPAIKEVETPSSTVVEIKETIVLPNAREEKKIIEVTSVQRGLKPGETRATFIVKEEALEKIKAIAYWDRQNIKDIIQTAIDAYIKQYENAKGAVLPIP